MSLRRGLIGLSLFIFLISSVGLVTLTLDDQRDLSSRAALIAPTNFQTTPEEIALISNQSSWSGKNSGLPDVLFDQNLWSSPSGPEPIFTHNFNQSSVRLGKSSDFTPNKLRTILGQDFILKRNLGEIKTNLVGWKVNGYIYNFFGEEKHIYIWQGPSNISLLSVLSSSLPLTDIEGLANGIQFSNASVKGVSTLDDSAKLAALIRPSVVMIATSYCAQVKISTLPGTNISDKSYPFCLAITGSGFFVNPQGYIATNGHVVKVPDNSTVIGAVTSGQVDNLLVDFTQDYYKQMGEEITRQDASQRVQENKTKKESLLQFAGAFIKLKESNFLKVEEGRSQYFIQAGETPIKISSTGVNLGKDILEAELIDSDYEEPDPVKGFSSSDIALLKVNGNNYPSLLLGDISDAAVGSQIQIFGFPGIVSGTNSQLLDTSSTAEPTVTRGVISALKKARGDQRNLIQTDASINHGNSGGPGVDSKGNVIGIATYGLVPEEGSGNFNFLRDVADLKALMKKNNIENIMGDTYKYWKQGLESNWLSYFKYAQIDLKKVKALYPIHPTVDKYLNEINIQVDTPADITPLIPRSQRRIYMSFSLIIMAISLFSSMSLMVIEKVQKNKPILLSQTPPTPQTT